MGFVWFCSVLFFAFLTVTLTELCQTVERPVCAFFGSLLCREMVAGRKWLPPSIAPQWGAADAEIKVPSVEDTELKGSPFKACSRSVYSHTCYAYCRQGFLPCLFLPFRSIHLHFFQNLSHFFPVLAVANTGSCVGRQIQIGHPVGCRFPY